MASTLLWTREQLLVLHMLYTDYTYLEEDDRASLFNDVFKDELQNAGLAGRYDTASLRSEYSARFLPGSGNNWTKILDGLQRSERRRLQMRINKVEKTPGRLPIRDCLDSNKLTKHDADLL